MQGLQRTFQAIVTHLTGLSATAKMLIGSLMIILVMTLFLVSLYTGRESLVPLGLSATAGPDVRAKAVSYLQGSRISHEVAGSDVLVPADQKYGVLAYLTETQVIGADQINFDRLMSDENLFRTRDQNRQRYLVAKMNVLSAMIGQMTGIERATVVLDSSENTGIGRSHVPASASVTVLTRSADLTQAQVDAIARLVAGAHAGLKPGNVAIVDSRSGRYLQARGEDSVNAGRYMEVKLEAERHTQSTLENALNYIPGVRISVNAQVDTKQVVQTSSKYDEPKVGVLNEKIHSITSSGASASAEPGLVANVGKSISGGNRGSSLSDEKSETSSVPFVSSTSTKINDSKGYALKINATIGVPKSYFVRLFKDQADDESKSPSQTELDALVQSESDRIKTSVAPLIDTQALESAEGGLVQVSMIPDFMPIRTPEEAQVELASATSQAPTDGLMKYLVLGGLGALSVAMMFFMVRKVNSRPSLPTPAELVGIPPALAAVESDIVGEADEAAPALEGLELNDDAIRRQQMLDQITDMVTAAPDEAAGLMRRWMKSEA